MELHGKVIEILPEKSGKSGRGQWRKQEYILETEGQYPKKVCFMVWGDKIDEFAIKGDEELSVSIDIESREYNGRWYTDVKAWQVKRESASPSPIQDSATVTTQSDSTPTFEDDDIPF